MSRPTATVSPLACRYAVGMAVRVQCAEAGLTTTEVARRAGIDRTVVSKIISAERRAGLETVLALLDVLPMPGGDTEYQRLQQAARNGLRRGWWEERRYELMGDRQKVIADLECGATVREYHPSMLPGLLQTEGYSRHRGEVALAKGGTFDLDATVRGRMDRQRIIAEGARYEAVLEMQAVVRLSVPPAVMREQLRHLHEVMTTRENVTVRILPVDAQLPPGWVPRNPFSLYTYADLDGLALASVDTVKSDLLVTSPPEVTEYAQMHTGLLESALSAEDSAALVRETAEQAGRRV